MKTQVYRYYDADGLFLYVGVSKSAMDRARAHRQHSDWFEFATRIEIEHFATRHEALSQELYYIKAFSPVFNVAGKACGRASYRSDDAGAEMHGGGALVVHAPDDGDWPAAMARGRAWFNRFRQTKLGKAVAATDVGKRPDPVGHICMDCWEEWSPHFWRADDCPDCGSKSVADVAPPAKQEPVWA